MNNLRRHCDELQTALAVIIRHELRQYGRGGPFIVLGSETGLECCGEFWGLTSRKMGIWLQAEIPDWQNGPAWLLNDSQILADCGGDIEAANNVTNAVCVHEITHCLLIQKLCGDLEPADERGRELFPQLVSDTRPAAQYEVDIDQTQHGAAFIRTMLHVRWRMIQAGWSIPFSDLMNWERYTRHPGEWFRMALRDEFQRLACVPISAVQHVPASDEFLRLFEGSTVLVES